MARKYSGTEVECSAQQPLLDESSGDVMERLHRASLHIDDVVNSNTKMKRSNSRLETNEPQLLHDNNDAKRLASIDVA